MYEAVSDISQQIVIAKVFDIEDEADEDRVQHEFELIRSLEIDGIVRALDLRRVGNQLVLLLEHIPGTNLAEYAAGRAVALASFWQIATQIADILAATHAARVIHRDIKPANILIETSSQRVYLADFGISVLLENERRHIYDSDVLVGTLPYISPEQTGRTSRAVDFRSDLYSLGVTFYELLTGRRPFEHGAPLELIHAHLALEAPAPATLRKGLPQGLSRLVMKLLAKAPEQRYQTALGLAEDLRALWAMHEAGESDELFELGKNDHGRALHIPRGLFGREREREWLYKQFEIVADEGLRRTLTLAGPQGVGKSALLGVLESAVLERSGYLMRGACRESDARPYGGFIDAISGLFEQLLTESDARLERWRRLLLGGLGSLASVVGSLIPEFELVVGSVPEAEALAPEQAHNRLQVTIERLITVICSTGPMVLALENLQHIDLASLRLLDALVHGSSGPLLIVTTVRPKQVDEGHELRKLAARIESLESFALLEVRGLGVDALSRYLCQAMPGLEDPHGLAKLVARKTHGVPLFIEQLLPRLVESGALQRRAQAWCWDPEAVEAAPISADAVTMMHRKLAELDADSRTLLQCAACIGEHFDLERLSLVSELGREQFGARLVLLEDAGLLCRVSGGYGFAHESIRIAARDGLADAQMKHMRWRLGQALLPKLEHDASLLFEVVDHLDAGSGPDFAQDTIELAQLSARAAQSALEAGSHELARRYLDHGLARIEPQLEAVRARGSAAPAYELAFRLHFNHAAQLAQSGAREQADAAFEQLLAWPLDEHHYAEIVARRLAILWASTRLAEAVELGLGALARLGLEVPQTVERPRALLILLETWGQVRELTLESVAELPRCEDRRAAGMIAIISQVKRSSFAIDNNLFLYLMGMHAALCVEHGYHPTMPLALGELAIGVCGALGRVAQAVRLQDLAGELARREPKASETRLLSVAGALTLHRGRPFSAVIAQFDVGINLALEAGEFDSASMLEVFGLNMQLEVGTHLRVLDRRCRKSETSIGRWSPDQMRLSLWVLRGLCHGLIDVEGTSEDSSGELVAQDPDAIWNLDLEQVELRRGAPPGYHIALIDLAMIRLVLSDAKGALEYCWQYTRKGARVLFNTFMWGRGAAIACMAYYIDQLAGEPGTPQLATMARDCLALLESWAAECPSNYGHYLDLVEGLRHAVRGQNPQALDALDRAWAQARQRGCRWVEGIAAEQLVAQYERQGLRAPVEGVWRRVWEAYAAWGAEAKLEQLRRAQPALFRESPLQRRDTAAIAFEQDTAGAHTRSLAEPALSLSTPALDLSRVLRSVGAISEDLRLEEVIARVLDAALTNVGADHGLLVLEQGGELALVAESAGVEQHEIFADAPLVRDNPERAPLSLINFVTRTAKPVLLDDASEDMRFAGDPYLERSSVRSILAMPLLKGERRLGVLVLENHLSSHGFGSVSLEALKLITNQAGSTLENAQLYNELQRSQERWRSLVDGAPDLIALLNERGAMVFRNHDGPLRGIDETHDEDDEGGLLTSESGQRWREAVEAVLQHGLRQELELEFRPARGGSEWYAVRVAPIEVHRGIGEGSRNYRNAVAVATDITARRRAENEMQELEAQLRQQQRLESVGTLASGVAHEINNPIQGIMNYADLIYGNATDRELVEDFASEINHESRRVAKIVRNLLAFSRQDATEVPDPVIFADVVDSSLSLIRAVLRRDNITIELAIEPDLPRVMCRAQQVQQVIMNLVTNARDALNERYGEYHARKRIEISVKPSPRAGWQLIGVRDWGPGIPPHVVARIFDPFFTTKGRDQGTGLGLAVSHGIIQEHGSELSVETVPGEGTCFSFELEEFGTGV